MQIQHPASLCRIMVWTGLLLAASMAVSAPPVGGGGPGVRPASVSNGGVSATTAASPTPRTTPANDGGIKESGASPEMAAAYTGKLHAGCLTRKSASLRDSFRRPTDSPFACRHPLGLQPGTEESGGRFYRYRSERAELAGRLPAPGASCRAPGGGGSRYASGGVRGLLPGSAPATEPGSVGEGVVGCASGPVPEEHTSDSRLPGGIGLAQATDADFLEPSGWLVLRLAGPWIEPRAGRSNHVEGQPRSQQASQFNEEASSRSQR